MRYFLLATVILCSAEGVIIRPALAQDEPNRAGPPTQGDEIVVTATKREERLIDVPISITALDEQKLQRINADRFNDYVGTVPGLVYNQSGANSGSFAIRGISTSSIAGNTQSPVAIYYDDLPTLDTFGPIVTPDLRLFDISRVEVLRGPQGTLFGSGAEAGAIRIITNKPVLDRVDAKGRATFEATRYGNPSYGLNAMVNMPLASDSLAMRLVAYYRRDGGYVDNDARYKNDVNRQDSFGGRAMLKWQANSDLSLLGTITYQKDSPRDSNFSDYNAPGYTYSGSAPQPIETKSTIYNLVAEYQLPFATITSSTTYNDRYDTLSRDFTGRLSPLLARFGLTGPFPAFSYGPSRSFAQEVRIASHRKSPFTWLIGGFYLRNKRLDNELINYPGAGKNLGAIGFPSDNLLESRSSINSREVAVFGEASYEITDRLKLTAGLRYFDDRIQISSVGDGLLNEGMTKVDRLKKERAATPKFALSYRLGRNLRLYAQAAKGYRVGQNNLTPANDPTDGKPIPGTYNSDSLWNYELGLKSIWLKGAITANAGIYAIDFNDIQLQAQSKTGYNYIANAGNARSIGGELELVIHPNGNIEMGTSLAYTATRLESIASGVDALVGDRLPGTPEFTASNYLQIETPIRSTINGFVRAEHQYFGKAYSNLNNPAALTYGDYNIFNLRAGSNFGRFGISLFVDNVSDSHAKANAFFLPDGPAAVRLRPRTVGITLTAGI